VLLTFTLKKIPIINIELVFVFACRYIARNKKSLRKIRKFGKIFFFNKNKIKNAKMCCRDWGGGVVHK